MGCGQWLASTSVLCELSRAFQKWWVPCQDRLTLPVPSCTKAACRIPFIFSVGLRVPIPGSGDRSRQATLECRNNPEWEAWDGDEHSGTVGQNWVWLSCMPRVGLLPPPPCPASVCEGARYRCEISTDQGCTGLLKCGEKP